MIRDVYILKRSGEVLIHKAFSKRGVDEAIFSGFYQAISAFAEELGHGGIETISMGDVSFFYQHGAELLFAIASDKDHDHQAAQSILSDVKDRFLLEFTDAVSSWNGDPSVFSQFSKTIEEIVTASRSISIEEGLFTIPFALDGKKLKSFEEDELDPSVVLDVRHELAAVHLLMDDIRRSRSDFKEPKEGCFEFLTKLLWPIWIVGTPDNRFVLVDGLSLIHPKVTYGFVPPINRYEALLKVDSSPNYLAVLGKLEEEVREAARSTPFEINVLPADLSHLIHRLCRVAKPDSQFSVQLPSEITRKQAEKEAERFHSEAIQTYKEAFQFWTEFQTYFKEDIQKWTERTETEISSLEEHYERRRAELKREIDQALTNLAKQENTAKAEIDDWRLEQEHKLRLKLKDTFTTIDQQITTQRTHLDSHLTNETPKDPAVEQYSADLLSTLDQLDTFSSELRTHTKTTRREIQQIQREITGIQKEVTKRLASVRSRFQTLETQEMTRLDELEEERQQRIKDTKERLGLLEERSQTIDSLIHDHIMYNQDQLAIFDKYLMTDGATLPTDLTTPIYIPIYLTGLQKQDGTTQLLIIPPLRVPPGRGRTSDDMGQRDAPVAALAEPFLTHVKTQLERAFQQNPKFAKLAKKFAPRHNLLTNSHVESLLYSGLHALWQSKLIPEKTHTQVKLACIDAYRTTNGKSSD